MDDNKVLKEQVGPLQEDIRLGRLKWEVMKAAWQTLEASVENKIDVASQAVGNKPCQVDFPSVKESEGAKRNHSKDLKSWTQSRDKFTNKEVEANTRDSNTQGREIKERQSKATNVIIKGVKEYGRGEHNLDLARDFLRDMVAWQGQICQAWRVGKFCDEKTRPIKVIMSSICDRQGVLSKKQLLRGSLFFLDEDLTVRQQEERKEEMEKVRAARDEGKRAWLYKGKVVISCFGPYSNLSQRADNSKMTTNSLVERKAATLT